MWKVWGEIFDIYFQVVLLKAIVAKLYYFFISDNFIRFNLELLTYILLTLSKKDMFSKSCEYAIRSCIFIATRSLEGECVNLKAISKEIDSPEAFTGKILQELVRNEIVQSIKGAMGGFVIDVNKLEVIKLKDIVFAIDGDSIYTMCSLGMKECSEEHPCPVHDQYKIIKKDITRMLETTDLKQLCSGLKAGTTFLKID